MIYFVAFNEETKPRIQRYILYFGTCHLPPSTTPFFFISIKYAVESVYFISAGLALEA